MKVISLTEAKTNLSRYGQQCRDEAIIVTVNGVPSFHLVSIAEDEDLLQELLDKRPGFKEEIEKRLRHSSC